MSKLVLQKIIKECSFQTMTTRQVQFTLFKLASYLNDAQHQEVKRENQNDKKLDDLTQQEQQVTEKWKEYIDKQVERVEEVFLRKLAHVEKVQNRIGGLCQEFEKMNLKIVQVEKMESRIGGLSDEIRKINNKVPSQQRIKGLSDDIKKIESKLSPIQKINGLNDQIEKINNKLTQIQKSEIRIGGICEQIEKIKNMMKEQENSFVQKDQLLTKNVSENEKCLSKMEISLTDRIQKINSEVKSLVDKIASVEVVPSKVLERKQKIHVEQRCSDVFSFDGKTLKKLKINKFYCQFIFEPFIPFDRQFTFKIKIVASKGRRILIGVVDYDEQKQEQTSCDSKFSVCYFARGFKYPGEIQEGDGICVGETVEVKVNRKQGSIKWFVCNEQIASHTHEMLGDQKRNLKPYVEMGTIGDTIRYSL